MRTRKKPHLHLRPRPNVKHSKTRVIVVRKITSRALTKKVHKSSASRYPTKAALVPRRRPLAAALATKIRLASVRLSSRVRRIIATFAHKQRLIRKVVATSAVAKPKAVFPKKQVTEFPWPPEFQKAFVITIRQDRYDAFRSRMGPWASHVQKFKGTHGSVINVNSWKKQGIVAKDCKLKRGQLGCYDSHIRIWKQVVAQQIPMAVVLEDDVNMCHSKAHADRLRLVLDELKRLDLSYHVMYIAGYGRKVTNVCDCIAKPKLCNTTTAYTITLAGAEFLLKHAFPYRVPVDVFLEQMHDKGSLNALAIDPPLCHMVPGSVSDTERIM